MGELLKDRVAVLVGVGAAGETLSNGRATALEFARNGATLVLADREEVALAACVQALEPIGGRILAVKTDATRERDVEHLVDTCRTEFGRIDILHNNLGMASVGRITKTTAEDFDLSMAVNVKSVFLLCKYALRLMEEHGHGVITNVSSISSIRHLGIRSPLYDITKAGLNALSRHLSVEFGPKGIRTNTILVGMMDTPLARQSITGAGREIDDIYANYVKRIPLRRMGTAQDTAQLATFLASDLAAYINGAEMVVDGGLTVRSA